MRFHFTRRCLLFACGLLIGGCLSTGSVVASEQSVKPGKTDKNGFLVHHIESRLQAGPTKIKILRPDSITPNKRYRAVYILPVEAGEENRYGDGLIEVKKHDLHNKYQVIFVAPTFTHLPWYADHAKQPHIRQEHYFLDVVIPFVEKTYPVAAEKNSRLLLGFSKSGWGAWSLLLRHPDRFGRAAAWDAPLMMQHLGKYGSAPIFGTQGNFENYRISDLLRKRAADLQKETRLILTGYGNFRDEHQRAHTLMRQLNIMHEYRDGPKRKHDWHSGWVTEAAELLLKGNN